VLIYPATGDDGLAILAAALSGGDLTKALAESSGEKSGDRAGGARADMGEDAIGGGQTMSTVIRELGMEANGITHAGVCTLGRALYPKHKRACTAETGGSGSAGSASAGPTASSGGEIQCSNCTLVRLDLGYNDLSLPHGYEQLLATKLAKLERTNNRNENAGVGTVVAVLQELDMGGEVGEKGAEESEVGATEREEGGDTGREKEADLNEGEKLGSGVAVGGEDAEEVGNRDEPTGDEPTGDEPPEPGPTGDKSVGDASVGGGDAEATEQVPEATEQVHAVRSETEPKIEAAIADGKEEQERQRQRQWQRLQEEGDEYDGVALLLRACGSDRGAIMLKTLGLKHTHLLQAHQPSVQSRTARHRMDTSSLHRAASAGTRMDTSSLLTPPLAPSLTPPLAPSLTPPLAPSLTPPLLQCAWGAPPKHP
jgi:hypothetical protein